MTPSATIILACILGSLLGLIAGAVCWRIVPRCERCGRTGPVARCLDCGKWLCRSCKPREGLCPECWETPDGIEADRLTRLQEEAFLENMGDQLRLEIAHGERLPDGSRIRD